jgi:hypothetical protein
MREAIVWLERRGIDPDRPGTDIRVTQWGQLDVTVPMNATRDEFVTAARTIGATDLRVGPRTVWATNPDADGGEVSVHWHRDHMPADVEATVEALRREIMAVRL